jgi:hypothetical protein
MRRALHPFELLTLHHDRGEAEPRRLSTFEIAALASGVGGGNVNLMITATSGGISHSAPITVIVNPLAVNTMVRPAQRKE